MRINKLIHLAAHRFIKVLAFISFKLGCQKATVEIIAALRLGDLAKLGKLHSKACRFEVIASLYGTLLHSAYRLSDGNIEVLRFFLDIGFDPQQRDRSGNTLLDTAVIEGRMDLCRLLLTYGVTLQVTDDSGFTSPIQKAIRYEQEQILVYFLKYLNNHEHLKPVVTDVLKVAVTEERIGLLEQVLVYDIDVHRVFEEGASLLHFVKSPAVLIKLCKYGFDINQQDEFGISLIAKLVMDDRHELAQALLTFHPCLTDGVTEYSDLILAAAKNNNQKLLKLLIAQESESGKYSDFRLWIIIDCVEDKFSLDIMRLFIIHGADINSRNHHSETALMIAAKNNNPYYVRFLVKAGADPNLLDSKGQNALMHAIINKSEKCIMPLLGSTVDIFHRDKKGFDITLHCIARGTELIAGLLIAKGLQLVQLFKNRQTSLTLAAMANNVEMIGLLIQLGVDINAVDNRQRSALMYAAGNGLQQATQCLLVAGADSSLVDKNGNTAESLSSSKAVKSLFRQYSNTKPNFKLTEAASCNQSENTRYSTT